MKIRRGNRPQARLEKRIASWDATQKNRPHHAQRKPGSLKK